MACEGKTYNGLTPPMMQGIRRDLRQMGMEMPETDEGVVIHASFGVEVEYTYSVEAHALSVRVRAKPFFVPCSMIYDRLDQAIERRTSRPHDPMADR